MKRPKRVPFAQLEPDLSHTHARQQEIVTSLARLVNAARDLEDARIELRMAQQEMRALLNPFLSETETF